MTSTNSGSILGLERRTFLLLALIIVLFIVAATTYTYTMGRVFSKPSGDGIAYERAAVQLLQKGFYGYKSATPNAQMSPGYPLFLAAVYGASGHTSTSTRPRHILDAIQILIACSTLVGIFLIGRKVADDWVGLFAALLVAAYPPMSVATNLWLTETLTTALIVWYLYVTLLAFDQDGLKLWIMSGAMLGVVVLIRPGFIPVAIAPFVVRFFWGKREHVFKLAAVSALAFILVMTPWMVRNALVVHELAPLSSHGGDPILAGVDPYYYEGGSKFQFHGPTYQQYQDSHSSASKSEVANATIAAGLRQRPLQTIWWFTIGKTVRMYTAGWLDQEKYVGTWSLFIRGLIVALGWVGCAYAFKEPRLRVICAVLVIGTAALLSVGPEPRYVFSWIAVLTVPAAFVLRRLWTAPAAPFQLEAADEDEPTATA